MNKGFPVNSNFSFSQKLVIWFINIFPLNWRVWFFECWGRIIFSLDLWHRRITLRNLALAFPEKSEADLKKIGKDVFRNLGRVAAEFSFIPKLNKENVYKYVSLEGEENFREAYEKGRGVIFLTAHFGNWEWMAATFPLLVGLPCYVVMRPLDNKFLDQLVETLRTWTGNKTIPKKKAMGRMLRLLKNGEIIGVLLDQNVDWNEGVFVNFFGELACTNLGLASLALRTGTPVLPAFNIREKNGRYRVIIEPEISLIRSGDKNLDILQNTQIFTQIIEKYVRAYPDHWLWLHRRWKTRPWRAKNLEGRILREIDEESERIMEEGNIGISENGKSG